jgi:Flp pilus assembly protein TadD
MVVAALALVGCPSAPQGPGPSLIADPPATPNGKPPGAGLSDFDKGKAYIEKEAWDEALTHLDKALEANPDNAEAHYFRGVALKFLGKDDEAQKALEHALKLNSGLVEAHLHLGDLLMASDPPNAKAAIPHLKIAADADPKEADARSLLAFAYAVLEDWPEAVKHYQKALDIKDSKETRWQLADAMMRAGDDAAAVVEMKKLLVAYGDDPKMTVELGKRFARAKAYDECVEAHTAAIKVEAQNPELYVLRGVCHHELKAEKAARTDFEKAIAIKADYQPAYYYLGQSWLFEKRRQQAADAFEKAVKLGRDTFFGKKAKAELEGMADKKKP